MIKEFKSPSPALNQYLRILAGRGLFQKEKKRKVAAILEKVKKDGDKALIELTKIYDKVTLTRKTLAVSQGEINEAIKRIPPRDKKLLRHLKKRLFLYHQKIKPCSWKSSQEGLTLGEIWRPLQRAGLYVPAGHKPLVSSLLMLACPAKAAGVKEIILVTPPSGGRFTYAQGLIDPYILYTAHLLGIKKIYKAGGAQAIAALAFGTETIPAVEKIAGPGNVYVTLAKKELYGEVGLDLLAGPSEILILADETAPPEYIAMDLFSQAEHGPEAAAILITASKSLIKGVKEKLVGKPLNSYGSLILVPSLKEGIRLVNEIAPEHLELMIKNPQRILSLIKNAGAIFMGPYSPVPLGDYAAGPSHVLPTSRTSRFSQGLTTQTFMKRISLISSGKKGFLKLSADGLRMAEIEGLPGHQQSFAIRRK